MFAMWWCAWLPHGSMWRPTGTDGRRPDRQLTEVTADYVQAEGTHTNRAQAGVVVHGLCLGCTCKHPRMHMHAHTIMQACNVIARHDSKLAHTK